MDSIVERLLKDKDVELLLGIRQEKLILDGSTEIHVAMCEQKVTRAQLMQRLGVDRHELRRLIDGNDDITLRELATVLHALGREARFSLKPITP